MCLLVIVVAVTLLRSGIYYSIRRSSVYTTVAVIVGLGILWTLALARKKPDGLDKTNVVPDEMKGSE